MKPRDLLSSVVGSRFRQNFVKVALANLFALALSLLATPIMTRLFVPGDYGALAVFTSILAVLMAFATWRFDWVIPNARSTTMAASLFVPGVSILLATCLGVFLALTIVDVSILQQTPLAQLGYLLENQRKFSDDGGISVSDDDICFKLVSSFCTRGVS